MSKDEFSLDFEMRRRLITAAGSVPELYVSVNVPSQTLALVKHGQATALYPVSTSKFGVGNQENSFKTPAGIHRIVEKIGAGAPLGRIFKSRQDTGQNWKGAISDENLILTRILRLTGLEPGINKGPGIDSLKRYIYIHGTNQERFVGAPASHGCICMKNSDIIDIFDKVPEKTIVLIC